MLYNPKSLGPKLSPSGGYRTLGEGAEPVRARPLGLVENLPRERRKVQHRRRSNPDSTMVWVAGGAAVLLAGFGIGMLLAAAKKRAALQSGAQRTAVKITSFHLRPTAVDASVGVELPAGTRLTLVEQGSLRRDTATMWKVRTAQGSEGWTYVLPSEIHA